jgi:SAM-dependent methyltransferase|uniref:Class I SAM-dependent methyltransferase n=1 Tax=Desulfobacca acetoxidans TaxID=60893 RepID=A0A7V6A619_9BACT
MDKAGEQYWTKVWGGTSLPVPIRVEGRGPRAWFYREFHHLWERHLPSGEKTIKLLEIGCAQSRWLPYFARHWGYAVAGLDYSELGCLQSRALLEREGVEGEIFHQDLFSPLPGQLAGYDLVFSNGVVEHFDDTVAVLRQMATYLKPGGLMITLVPNLAGWLGYLQKLVSPEVMAIHRPLSREELGEAHAAAGLHPQVCTYLAFLHFSVVNSGDRWHGWRKSCFCKGLKGATVLARTLCRLCPGLSSDRRTAGYIVCIAAKAAGKKDRLFIN